MFTGIRQVNVAVLTSVFLVSRLMGDCSDLNNNRPVDSFGSVITNSSMDNVPPYSVCLTTVRLLLVPSLLRSDKIN